MRYKTTFDFICIFAAVYKTYGLCNLKIKGYF